MSISAKALVPRIVVVVVALLALHSVVSHFWGQQLTAPDDTGLAPEIHAAATGDTSLVARAGSDLLSSPIAAPANAAAPSRPAATPVAVNHTSIPGIATDLNAAERLLIKFQGFRDLTGEYRIGADNIISIPVLGRIQVTGLNAAELERTLMKRVSTVSGRQAYVTVEIAEHKPVFVTGYVSRPGTAPWKPGMTILHALTIVGGSFRTSESEGNAVMGAQSELVAVKRAVSQQRRLYATIARLQAEAGQSSIIEVPERLVQLVGEREAKELIDDQITVLRARSSAVESQRAALERAIAISRKELIGLSQQSAKVEQALELRRDQKSKIDGLAKKGWARTGRALEEQSRIIDLEEKAINISVAIARIQGELAKLEREAANLLHNRRAEIAEEILEEERKADILAIDIASASANYRRITGKEPDTSSQDISLKQKSVVQYNIVRQDNRGLETIKADPFTALRPGDMVVVSAL